MKLRYIGGRTSVTISDAFGSKIFDANGDAVEVDDVTGRSLLEQPDRWIEEKKKTKKTVATVTAETEGE